MKVTKRKVWRVFINGKGYANLAIASKAMAKKSLGRRIENQIPYDLDTHEQRLDAVQEVLERMFPHELGDDGMPLNCEQCWWSRSYRDGSPVFAYSWCRTARNEWIAHKATEIRVRMEIQLKEDAS